MSHHMIVCGIAMLKNERRPKIILSGLNFARRQYRGYFVAAFSRGHPLRQFRRAFRTGASHSGLQRKALQAPGLALELPPSAPLLQFPNIRLVNSGKPKAETKRAGLFMQHPLLEPDEMCQVVAGVEGHID